MKISLYDLLHRIHLPVAVGRCVAVCLSYLVGASVTGHFHEASHLTGAMLTCTSAIVVLQQNVQESIHRGWLRVLGTFFGAVVAFLYLTVFPFTLAGMIGSLFILEILCMLLDVPDNGKMASITLVVVLIVSTQSPGLSPLMNGLLRFMEAAIGAGIGITTVWVLAQYARWMTKK
ncbi:MAG: FUSC family protein [Alistipes sp.]